MRASVGAGNDLYDGGTGKDTASFASATQTVTVNLGAASNQALGAEIGFDQLRSIEHVTGGGGNDSIAGSNADNQLSGGAGDDTLSGLGGNDRLVGGAGIDTSTGGQGLDRFVLMAQVANRDIIQDFKAAQGDLLEIAATQFGGGLAAGVALTAAQFVANTTGLAGDADDRFIFNTATAQLFFDPNGNGGRWQPPDRHLHRRAPDPVGGIIPDRVKRTGRPGRGDRSPEAASEGAIQQARVTADHPSDEHDLEFRLVRILGVLGHCACLFSPLFNRRRMTKDEHGRPRMLKSSNT